MSRSSAVTVYLVFSVVTSLCNALMFTLQHVYYVESAGLSPLQLVLVGTVMELTALVFEVPTGLVADVVSRRLSVIVGVVISGLGFLVQGLIPSVEAILIGGAIWGFGWTFISGALQAWIAGEVGEERLQSLFLRASRYRQIAALVGIVLATALGSIQLFVPIVVGSVGTMLLGGWMALRMPEQGFERTPDAERSHWREMGETFVAGVRVVRFSPVLLSLVGISLIAGGASEGYDRLWEAHILQNIPLPIIGGLSTVVWFGIIQVGGQLLGLGVLTLASRHIENMASARVTRVLFACNTIVAFGLFAYAQAPNIVIAIGALWLLGVTRAISGPIYDAWLTRHIAPRSRATVFSFLSQSDALGQLGFGPVVGTVGTWYGLRAALSLAAAFTLPASALYWSLVRRDRAEPAEEGTG